MVVALIGFMGAGKSTVGRILASKLGATFVDLDDIVVREAGMPIAEIFRLRGEPAFRDLESACLRAVVNAGTPTVVATGGGAPLRAENRALLRRRARTFFLALPFDELASRTAGDASRPLRAGSAEELRSLYESRLPVYEALGERIDAEGRSPDEIARTILQTLGTREDSLPE